MLSRSESIIFEGNNLKNLTQHSNKFFLRCKTWCLAKNICFVAYFISHEDFNTVLPTLSFNTQFATLPHELNPSLYQHGHYHLKGEVEVG